MELNRVEMWMFLLSWKGSRAECFSLGSFMYFSAFIFPLLTQILSTPCDVIQSQTITLTACFTVGVMQSGWKSPILLVTYFMPSLPNGEILVSWLQITLSYCSVVQVTWVLAQFNLYNLCLRDKHSFCRILACISNSCSLRWTVLALNFTLYCARIIWSFRISMIIIIYFGLVKC